MLPGCFYKNIAAFFFSKGQVNMVASTPLVIIGTSGESLVS